MIDLFPGVFMTVKMVPDSIGTWLLHCHVNDHMIHGMDTTYIVEGSYSSFLSSTRPRPTYIYSPDSFVGFRGRAILENLM